MPLYQGKNADTNTHVSINIQQINQDNLLSRDGSGMTFPAMLST